MVAVICASIEMVGDGPVDTRPVKKSGCLDRLSIDRIKQAIFQNRPKPVVRRDVETLLRSGQHRLWELVTHQLAKDVLEGRSANLQIVREAGGEFHDAMIEERRADFERMRHAHAIRLVEDVVGKVILLVDEQGISSRKPHFAEGFQQSPPLILRPGSVPEEMRFIGGQQRSREHAL